MSYLIYIWIMIVIISLGYFIRCFQASWHFFCLRLSNVGRRRRRRRRCVGVSLHGR